MISLKNLSYKYKTFLYKIMYIFKNNLKLIDI